MTDEPRTASVAVCKRCTDLGVTRPVSFPVTDDGLDKMRDHLLDHVGVRLLVVIRDDSATFDFEDEDGA